MKTIGIDCRLAGAKHAGIGRYVEELVIRVIKDTSVNWVLFLHEKNQIDLPKLQHVKIVVAPITHYSLAEQVHMPRIFSRENLDLLHVPHYNVPLFYPGKFVITIHDLLWHTQSNASNTTLSPLVHTVKYQAYKRVVSHATFWAQKIIVPTNHVKKEMMHHFPYLNQDKIVQIYEGVNKKFSIVNSQLSIQKSKILFYTGSLYPHKNVMLVVNALNQLPGYELYLSSSRSIFVDEFMNQVKKMGLESKVHHLGRLSDEELLTWYQKSTALVQPSLSEGFGLTGIEAMAVGLPVLASKIPIFSEVYKNAYISFDPHSVDSFVAAVQTLESTGQAKQRELGVAVSKKYTWDLMAAATLKVYTASL